MVQGTCGPCFGVSVLVRFLRGCLSMKSYSGCPAGNITSFPMVGGKAPAEFHRGEKGHQEENRMSLLCSFLSDTHSFLMATKTSVLLDVSRAPFPSADFARKQGVFYSCYV